MERPIWMLSSIARRGELSTGKDMFLNPALRRGDDGLSNRVARIRAMGNSIVPCVAAVPLQRIKYLSEKKC